MPLDRLIEQYKKQVRAARSSEVIFDVTLDAIRELGFNRLAIVHALWFTQPGRRLLFLHNFDEWGDIFVTRQYFRHDPALIASQRTNRPFTWNEMRRNLPPAPTQARILNEAGRHGLRLGLTVPVAVPGGTAGCCPFPPDASDLPSPPDRTRVRWGTSVAVGVALGDRRIP